MQPMLPWRWLKQCLLCNKGRLQKGDLAVVAMDVSKVGVVAGSPQGVEVAEMAVAGEMIDLLEASEVGEEVVAEEWSFLRMGCLQFCDLS